MVAVAQTIVVRVSHMRNAEPPYRELGAEYVDRLNADHLKRMLLKRLERLGLQGTAQSRAERSLALPG